MPRRRPMLRSRFRAIAAPIARLIVSARSMAIAALRSRRVIPIEVVTVDSARRRAVAREIRRALHQLRRALGPDFPANLAIVVQQVVVTNQPLAGCVQTHQRRDGTRAHLVRLALQVDGRRLSIDDVLAALTDACVGIVIESGGPSVLVPLGIADPHSKTVVPVLMRSDPLAPRSNGAITRAPAP
jgi:hypothetical protein